MAKAFEIKTGLDKLKSWAGMTNKKRTSAVIPLQVETQPFSVLWREQCVVFATAFSTVLRLDCVKPFGSFTARSFHFLFWLLQPWASLWITGIEHKNIWMKMWFPYLLIVIMIVMENPRETHKTSEGVIGWINTWITNTASKWEQHFPFGPRSGRRTPRIGWRPIPRRTRSKRPFPLLMMAALAMHTTNA